MLSYPYPKYGVVGWRAFSVCDEEHDLQQHDGGHQEDSGEGIRFCRERENGKKHLRRVSSMPDGNQCGGADPYKRRMGTGMPGAWLKELLPVFFVKKTIQFALRNSLRYG